MHVEGPFQGALSPKVSQALLNQAVHLCLYLRQAPSRVSLVVPALVYRLAEIPCNPSHIPGPKGRMLKVHVGLKPTAVLRLLRLMPANKELRAGLV